MYTHEERTRAVNLYIAYHHNAEMVIRKLGYPSQPALMNWYKEYKETGELREKSKVYSRYSQAEKARAVAHYMKSSQNLRETCRVLGYPHRFLLREWVDEYYPEQKKSRKSGILKYTLEQKEAAVKEMLNRDETVTVTAIAKKHGTTKASLYNWKNELLGEEISKTVKRPQKPLLPNDKDTLMKQLSDLKEQIYHKQMEVDILIKTAELLKKEQGIDQKTLTNKEKCRLIDALRETYPLNSLLAMIEIPKSSYFYQRVALSKADKYSDLREDIKAVFNESSNRYGYRRVHAVIRNSGKTVSEKVVRRIMSEENLTVPMKKRRKYNSYAGEISPAVENIVARDFRADKPNEKWLTDITEFNIPAGKVYLSPIIDCFDGLAVSWAIGTRPNAELVNDMLDGAISTLHYNEKPIVHSDRGGHYRWPGWIFRMDKAGLTRSMSKKACPPDNSACEGFFGTIKNEMFYHRSWYNISIEQFINELDYYLRWYNEKRIKMSLGAMSPFEYRNSIGTAA